MFDQIGEESVAALIGLAGGLLLGLAARLGRFCTLGAIEDTLYARDTRRLRMWGVAIGVAVIGSHLAIAAGQFDPGESVYLATAWMPLSVALGGGIFGYGMALAGNCGFGALARVGGGDLRSFVIVLVMGLAAYATLSGPLAPLRLWLFPPATVAGPLDSLPAGLAALTGLAPAAIGVSLGLALLALSLADRRMWTTGPYVAWGVVAGLSVVSAWLGTGWLAATGFAAIPLASHSFAAPLGESVLYVMTAAHRPVSFGIGSVAGVLAGAFLGSLLKGHFRWEACEDPRELRRQLLGAALMGIGAVLALGCTIGQGLSAFSLLAYSAPLAFAAIFAGAALGLRQLITGFALAR